MKPIVLASTSAVRAGLLTQAGLDVAVVAPEVDEAPPKRAWLAQQLTPGEIAQRLACAKAAAVSARRPGLVIGADQTLEFEGALHDKTANLDETRALLLRLAGQAFVLHTAAALMEGPRLLWTTCLASRLRMRAFSTAFLDTYLERNASALAHSLGGFELESQGAQLFDRIDGDYFSILGLPLIPLLEALRQAGGLLA